MLALLFAANDAADKAKSPAEALTPFTIGSLDDGNTGSGDGCDGSCQTEPGFVCPMPGKPCVAPVCGDPVALLNRGDRG